MWIVAKIKPKEISIFKEQIKEKFKKEIEFYEPKVFYNCNNSKKIKKILGNYIFCFNKNFKDNNILESVSNLKGLRYFLRDFKNSQRNIMKFIDFCKKHEDEKGFLIGDFFKKIVSEKGKFLNGPLANLVFEIIENNKNNLVLNVGQKKIFLKKDSKIFYLPA